MRVKEESAEEMLDRLAVESAEAEADAALRIIRVMKKLDKAGRIRVLNAASRLIEADNAVPGVMDTYLKGINAQRT